MVGSVFTQVSDIVSFCLIAPPLDRQFVNFWAGNCHFGTELTNCHGFSGVLPNWQGFLGFCHIVKGVVSYGYYGGIDVWWYAKRSKLVSPEIMSNIE